MDDAQFTVDKFNESFVNVALGHASKIAERCISYRSYLSEITTTHASVFYWGLLDSRGEMSIFQNFSQVRHRRKWSTRETAKPIGDNLKILRGELTNILR